MNWVWVIVGVIAGLQGAIEFNKAETWVQVVRGLFWLVMGSIIIDNYWHF